MQCTSVLWVYMFPYSRKNSLYMTNEECRNKKVSKVGDHSRG